jgi:hypothetical protein
VTACCSSCGKCGACTFHGDCSAGKGMVTPIVAVCSDDDCQNNANGLQVLVCIVCGRCGSCSFHGH